MISSHLKHHIDSKICSWTALIKLGKKKKTSENKFILMFFCFILKMLNQHCVSGFTWIFGVKRFFPLKQLMLTVQTLGSELKPTTVFASYSLNDTTDHLEASQEPDPQSPRGWSRVWPLETIHEHTESCDTMWPETVSFWCKKGLNATETWWVKVHLTD